MKKDQGNHTRCESGDFDKNTMEWCQDNWVFEDPEKTIGIEVSGNRDRETCISPTPPHKIIEFSKGGCLLILNKILGFLNILNI